jgi:hypothetical protein
MTTLTTAFVRNCWRTEFERIHVLSGRKSGTLPPKRLAHWGAHGPGATQAWPAVQVRHVVREG